MKRIPIIASLIFLAGCSPEIQVYSDFDPDYDLWTYKTFDWGKKVNIEEGLNPFHYNELTDKRIKSAVQDQLTTRGYQLTEVQPDLILHYHIIVEDKSMVLTEPYGYNYSSYWMRMETNIYSYRQGTLILDLMDSKTHNLIWRGWAVSAIDGPYSPEEKEKLINTAVARIFRKFPKTRGRVVHSNDIVSK